MAGRKWTEGELDRLRWLWGERLTCDIAKELGRSVDSVRVKAARCGLPTMVSSEKYTSLTDVMRRTGYGRQAIKAICAAINIRPRRIGCRYYFRREHVTRIERRLRELYDKGHIFADESRYQGAWGGTKPDACLECGTTERKHTSLGLCDRCYRKRNRESLQWGVNGRPSACVECGRTSVSHHARGLCTTCYLRELRAKKRAKP